MDMKLPPDRGAPTQDRQYPISYSDFVSEILARITDVDAMVAGSAALLSEDRSDSEVSYARIVLRDLIPAQTEALRNWIDRSTEQYTEADRASSQHP